MKTILLPIILLLYIHTPVNAATIPGLDYNYYEGTWSSLPDFDAITPVKTGASANIDLSVRKRDTGYAVLWKGYITIPANGDYTFETNSDDGSKLYIGTYSYDGSAVVNNDGVHYIKSNSGIISLKAGTYPIAIGFFQGPGGDVMEVYWSSNTGISRQRIPDNAFSHDDFGSGVSNPSETGGLTASINYYFSSSQGDDNRTSKQAQDASTPWKTLTKLNQVLLNAKPGTAFLLKRGDVFNGTISFFTSGSADSSIILSAYGTGSKPVITGLVGLGSWKNTTGNIWQADLKAGPRLNMLTVGGTVQMRGRWPNTGDADGGYLPFQSHSGFTSVTTNNYGNQDWYNSGTYGTEISIRSVRWMLNTYRLYGQSSGTFTYNGSADTMQNEPADGNGYFIQNDPRTLDQQNEWYYNPALQYVQMYSSVNPANLNIQTAVIDTLVKAVRVSNITIDNILFQGSNQQTIYFDQGSKITISNCEINYSGLNAVKMSLITNALFVNNKVSNTSNRAVDVTPFCGGSIIRNNAVNNTGMLVGLGGNGNLSNLGIFFHGDNSICLNNNVTNTAYDGIVSTGGNVLIKNNFVDSFCLRYDDGGGIYTSGPGTNRNIVGNIVLHGIGNTDGTGAGPSERLAEGIYLDEASENALIDSNHVAYCANQGLSIHDARSVMVTHNTFYESGSKAIGMMHDALQPDYHIRNITIKSNYFVSTSRRPARTANHNLNNTNSIVTLETNSQDYSDLTSFGTADSNYYIKPFNLNINDFFKFSYRPVPSGTRVGPSQDDSNAYRRYFTMDLAHWQATFKQDAHSTTGQVFPPYTVTNVETTTFRNGTFDANINYVLNPHADKSDANNNYITQSWDTTHLDKGALQVTYTPTSGGSSSGRSMEAWFVDREHIKTMAAGHTYRVKFSIMGSADHNSDFRCAMRSISDGESPWLFFKVYNKRQEVEMLFTTTVDIPEAYLVVINDDLDSCSTWWMDNLLVQEVSASYTNPTDYIRFEYNATSSSKKINLDGTYTDLKNNTYESTVTLEPYTSIVLINKKAAAVASQSAESANSVVLKDISNMLAEHTGKLELKLSPNPAKDYIKISLESGVSGGQAILTIVSTSGLAVKTEQIDLTNSSASVDISSLTSGAYILSAVVGSHVYTTKFIKF